MTHCTAGVQSVRQVSSLSVQVGFGQGLSVPAPVLYGLTSYTRCTTVYGRSVPRVCTARYGTVRQVCTARYGTSGTVRQVCTEGYSRVYGGYSRSTRSVRQARSWPRSRPWPALDGVAEGPWHGIVRCDALARAPYSRVTPTGDRRMDI